MSFREVKAEELTMNPFTKIGKEWLLITAGNEEKCNTMTASWGAMGVMWGKNAVTVYIRPQRYTKEFVDREDTFTISVLGEKHRKALNYCGKVSGKNVDNKIKEAGLTPYFTDGTAYLKISLTHIDNISIFISAASYSFNFFFYFIPVIDRKSVV